MRQLTDVEIERILKSVRRHISYDHTSTEYGTDITAYIGEISILVPGSLTIVKTNPLFATIQVNRLKLEYVKNTHSLYRHVYRQVRRRILWELYITSLKNLPVSQGFTRFRTED